MQGKATHFVKDIEHSWSTLCGQEHSAWLYRQSILSTLEWNKVTCKKCLKMKSQAESVLTNAPKATILPFPEQKRRLF